MRDSLKVYTDGGCTGNPGPGGWAAVILGEGEPQEISGGAMETTNNRMELMAVITALETIISKYGKHSLVEIFTDSQYVRKGMREWMPGWIAKNWKTAAGKPVKNKDLWLRLKDLDAALRVDWHWVQGHAGDKWNERCDSLVAQRRKEFN